MYQESYVVVGIGYGDEGKGILTNSLASYVQFADKNIKRKKKSLVIRFSGGHQAGHTVVSEDGTKHVFSTFGAGTLNGHDTFWSSYCTFLPDAVLKEYEALKSKGINPKLFVDSLAPVTTFYDYMLNQFKEKSKGNNRHGSCGVGFGTTMKRTLKTPYTFFAQDLLNPEIIRKKLASIEKYYLQEIENICKENSSISKSLIEEYTTKLDFKKATDIFIERIQEVLSFVKIIGEKKFFYENPYTTYVFEGSQGVLLDQNFGLTYPNVTMSNTTSKNALEIIQRNDLPKPKIYYVTRCYQTRHGNGWMSNENLPIKLKNNEKETNILNEYQGHFRTGVLDIDMINYAINVDDNFSYGLIKNICITCLDQIEDERNIPYTVKGELKKGSVDEILEEINLLPFTVLKSHSDKSDGMTCSSSEKNMKNYTLNEINVENMKLYN